MKYELVHDDTIEFAGYTFTRIRALRNIKQHNVETGDLGGYIYGCISRRLSQEGDDWLHAGGVMYERTHLPEVLLRHFEQLNKYVSDASVRRGDKEEIFSALEKAMVHVLDLHLKANQRGSKK